MEIIVMIKNVYGNELIYPVCDKAKRFARLSGRKTLSPRDIEIIEELGFSVRVQAPTIGR